MANANYQFIERKLPVGFYDKLDPSLLEFFCLVRGSQNVMVTDKGVIAKRKGYTLFGQDSQDVLPINSSYTWTVRNKEVTMRAYNLGLEAYYNGEYHPILPNQTQNINWQRTFGKMRFANWWDKTEGRDRLLFVNGHETIQQWTGGMTEIASWTSTTVTKKYAKQSSASNNFVFTAINRTLTQTDTDFITLGFEQGQTISITGSLYNDGIYTLDTVTTTTLKFIAQDVLVDETISNDDGIVGVSGRETWRAELFVDNFGSNTGYVRIGATDYTFNAGLATPTLTLTTDPTADCSVGLFVHQPVTSHSPTGGDVPTNFPIDIIESNLNQVYIANSLFNSVFLSTQDDFADFDYTPTIRRVGEGGTMYLDSNVKSIRANNQIVYVTSGQSDVYQTYLEAYSNGEDVGELIRVKKMTSGFGSSAVSQEGFCSVKNGLLYLSNMPVIDYLANVQEVNVTPISDPIKRYLDSLTLEGVELLYFKNNIYALFPKDGVIIAYDIARGFWQPPMTIGANSMCVFEGNILIHSSSYKKTYTLFKTLDDDGAPIDARAFTNIETYGTRSSRKIYDEFFVEAIVNQGTTSLVCQALCGYKGSTNIQTFLIGYNDEARFREQPSVGGGFGQSSFGSQPFGSIIADEDFDPEIGELVKLYEVDALPYSQYETFTIQGGFSNVQEGSYFEIISYGVNARKSPTTNVDIKK